MIKTKRLREKLKTEITSALVAGGFTSVPVYYGQAQTKGTTRNYIIFGLEEVTRLDGRIAFELEINCIDYGTNTANCEEIADLMQDALDHKTFITDYIVFNTYANRRNSVSDEDEQIIRRRLTFDLYLYERT